MIELCGDEERLSVLLGTNHMDGSLSNDLVGRVDGAHVYCDLTARDKLLEVRYDGDELSTSWALDEILSAGIRSILGDRE
jgi:hypothetical protein